MRGVFWLCAEWLVDQLPCFSYDTWSKAFHRTEDVLKDIHERTHGAQRDELKAAAWAVLNSEVPAEALFDREVALRTAPKAVAAKQWLREVLER